MNTYPSHSRTKIITALVSVAVIIGIVVLIEMLQNKSSITASPVTASSTSPSSASGSTSSTYKDGTYTADSTYYVPHGSEDIKVTLTVANGVVTDSSIVNSQSDDESAQYQQGFAAGYKTQVVGKKLSDINVSYVAGASDTTEGFNDALAQIRTQAQA